MIVDDHPIVRRGLTQLIHQEPDLRVCAECSDAAAALETLPHARPELVIVDISLRGMNGVELTKAIRECDLHPPVLVLSMHDERVYAERALRAGARGYVMKQEAAETVIAAIRRILAGELYVSEAVAARMLRGLVGVRIRKPRGSGVDALSDRQLEIFELIGRGLATREIAARLHLSVKTVETHRSHIKQKLQIATAAQLLHHAVHWLKHEAG